VAVCPTLFEIIVGPGLHFICWTSKISVVEVGPLIDSPPVTRMSPSGSVTTAGDDLGKAIDAASFHE
jgi:hypothetical protein